MRTALLTLTMVVTLMTTPLDATSAPSSPSSDAPKPEKPAKQLPADVGAGRVAWFDLSSAKLAVSKDFYGQLLGWTFGPVEGTDQAFEIRSRGTAIGTLRGADGAISAFNGVVYIQVDDLRATCAKAQELGGTVVPGFPFDLPDGAGAIGLIADPSGHPLGLYSRTRLPGAKP